MLQVLRMDLIIPESFSIVSQSILYSLQKWDWMLMICSRYSRKVRNPELLIWTRLVMQSKSFLSVPLMVLIRQLTDLSALVLMLMRWQQNSLPEAIPQSRHFRRPLQLLRLWKIHWNRIPQALICLVLCGRILVLKPLQRWRALKMELMILPVRCSRSKT